MCGEFGIIATTVNGVVKERAFPEEAPVQIRVNCRAVSSEAAFSLPCFRAQPRGQPNMGGRGASGMGSSSKALMPSDEGYGKPSLDGRMRKAIAWHGSDVAFDVFDGNFAFDYQSECHCSKTCSRGRRGGCPFDYQSECHCSKTRTRPRGLSGPV